VHTYQNKIFWAGDEDKLEGPQAHMGDGEEVVKADIMAAGLICVACEVFLFISPHLFCCHHKHQNSEEKNNREPNSAEGCGVFVHSAEEALENYPIHDDFCSQSVFSCC
uniref:Uncharacterized protein n=1 Tax=Maylandia zebra TaxID=106582 RepID=A0A3P9BDP1_9CICH